MPRSRPLKERFESKVVRANGCWRWSGNKHKQGYGKIHMDGGSAMAHRVSYLLHKGSIPDGMMVCHRCDNPECTNPDHLFLGTALDNMRDKIAKGRHVGAHAGEGHHFAKLTRRQVEEIRRAYRRGGVTQYELAARYGVTQTNISGIVNNRKWANEQRR